MRIITLNRPDDWHVHFRDHDALQDTVSATACHFNRALVMPNLQPALTSHRAIVEYRQRIMANIKNHIHFTPYMTLYLNHEINTAELEAIRHDPFVLGAKLYPAGATTNSEQGVQSILGLYPLLDVMQDNDLVLQIHGEVTFGDIFERERLFIETQLLPLIRNFPRLRIVLEHISTKAAVEFIQNTSENIAATITPHHLLFNRNHLLAGGIKPHYYCLPILKHEDDQTALLQAAVSGNPKFFAGTDSAPHTQHQKESACGCAGVYSAPFALAMYAQAFESQLQITKLDAFMSKFGAIFYQLPVLHDSIELVEHPQIIPNIMSFGQHKVIPLAAGKTLQWSIREAT